MPCHRQTYDNRKMVQAMVEQQRDRRVPSGLVPHCPRCGAPMAMNLRCDETFVEDVGWHRAAGPYADFLRRHEHGRVPYWELGVGANTPGIIKYPFWSMVRKNPPKLCGSILPPAPRPIAVNTPAPSGRTPAHPVSTGAHILHYDAHGRPRPCRSPKALPRRHPMPIRLHRCTVQHATAPSREHDVPLLVVKPTASTRPPAQTPGILWIHGGGYVTGMSQMVFMSRALRLVQRYGAVVVSPAYRLAPKHPYPAALHDCYAALRYLVGRADELGVNSSQIMVGGESAGGGLAAALCLYARDQGKIAIAYQMPLYPMIDDRDTASSHNNRAPVWNTRRNHRAWKAYLGDLWGTDAIPPYAAPARAEKLAGLPPAYTFVGDIEPFYCETLSYVERLREAGVEAAADVYPGCFHAFDMLLPFKQVSKQAIAAFEEHYRYAAAHYFAPQP